MKHNLRKKLIAAIVMAATAITGAGTAGAGTLYVTSRTYAVEAVCLNTTINLGGIVYTMGINRLAYQAFEIRYELPTGASFVGPLPDPVCDAPAAVITHKTGGVDYNFAGYDVSPTFGDIPVGTGIFWNPSINIKNPSIISTISPLKITVTLRDHISYPNAIDSTPIAKPFAIGAYATDFWNSVTGAPGVITDTGTTIDGAYLVPLAGFIVQNDDTALIAAATIQIKNTMSDVKDPKNGAAEDYVLTRYDNVTVTIEDPTEFLGLSKKTSIGLWWDLNDNLQADTDEIFKIDTVSKNKATLTLPGNHAGFGADHKVYYQVDGKTMLTERILKISGRVDSYCGTDHNLTTCRDCNDTWWVWGCPRGVVLQAPFVQIPPGWYGRFVLTNDCTMDAKYTVRYLDEGVDPTTKIDNKMTPTKGSLADSGTIEAKSTLVIDADKVLGVSDKTRPRGTAIFVIDAPSACVQGLYQVVNVTGGSVSNHVMVRPGTN